MNTYYKYTIFFFMSGAVVAGSCLSRPASPQQEALVHIPGRIDFPLPEQALPRVAPVARRAPNNALLSALRRRELGQRAEFNSIPLVEEQVRIRIASLLDGITAQDIRHMADMWGCGRQEDYDLWSSRAHGLMTIAIAHAEHVKDFVRQDLDRSGLNSREQSVTWDAIDDARKRLLVMAVAHAIDDEETALAYRINVIEELWHCYDGWDNESFDKRKRRKPHAMGENTLFFHPRYPSATGVPDDNIVRYLEHSIDLQYYPHIQATIEEYKKRTGPDPYHRRIREMFPDPLDEVPACKSRASLKEWRARWHMLFEREW